MNSNLIKPLLFLATIGLISSCVKLEVPQKEIGTTQNFKELKVEEKFTWTTTKPYELKIIGFETLNPTKDILRVKSIDGNILVEESRLMNESFTLHLDISLDQKQILVQYGSLEKLIELNSSEISFDYISARPAEIIEE